MKKKLVVVLLGPPGSGKGTQAKKIQEKFKLDYVGSGDLLRKRAQKKDFTGKKIAQVMNKGGRVPTPVVFNIWMNKFEEIKKFKGLVVDGSPRTVYEAKMLEEALEWYDWKQGMKVFFVKLSKRQVIKRLKKRRICESCGAITFNEQKECLKCHGRLVPRKDDSLEGVNVRWEWYNREVMPTVKFYQKNKNFFVVNGDQTIENVFKDILKKI
jgi:adenylate kinase